MKSWTQAESCRKVSLQTNEGRFDISRAEVLQQYFRNTVPQYSMRVSARNRAIYKQFYILFYRELLQIPSKKRKKWSVRWAIHGSTIFLFTYLCNLLDPC